MIQMIIVVAMIGLLVWAIEALVPMPAQFTRIIQVIAVLFTLIYLLQATGLIGGHVNV